MRKFKKFCGSHRPYVATFKLSADVEVRDFENELVSDSQAGARSVYEFFGKA